MGEIMKKRILLFMLGSQLLCSYDPIVNVNLQIKHAGDLGSNSTVLPTTLIYSKDTNIGQKLTYKNWFKEEWHDFPTLCTYVSEATKYVDFATRAIYTHYLRPDESIVTTITETGSHTYTSSQYLEMAESRYEAISLSESYSTSIFSTFDDIQLATSKNTATDYEFSTTIVNKYSSEKTKSYSFTSSASTTYNFHNTNNFGIYVQVEYRQKFLIHLIERKNINDVQHPNDRGVHGTDYTYTSSNTIFDKRILLLPVDQPYYCVSQYADNSQGKRVYLDKTEMNNILYY